MWFSLAAFRALSLTFDILTMMYLFVGLFDMIFSPLGRYPIVGFLYSFLFFLRQSLALVAQAGVPWHDLGSQQPLPHRFK